MKQLIEKYHNAKLNRKISLLVSVMLLVILLTCQVVLYFYVEDNVNKQVHNAADITLTQAQTYMEAKLRNVVERLFYIRLDPGFEDALQDFLYDGTDAAQGVAMTLLSPCLSLHKITEPLISSIYLYTPQSSFTDMGVSVEANYSFENSKIQEELSQSEERVVWGKAQKDEIFITHREVIPVMYRFTVNGYGGECVLVANIDKERLTAYLYEILPKDGSDIMILDEYGKLVTYTGENIECDLINNAEHWQKLLHTDEAFTETSCSGEQYLVAQGTLVNAPWRIVYMQSESKMIGQLKKIRAVFFSVSMFAVVIALVLLTKIVSSVTQPLSQLSQYMHGIEHENDMAGFQYPYSNEIGTLASSFNGMLAHIQLLLEEQEKYITQLQEEKENVKLEQQLKRRAELKALQAQINPHFLYNTLESIRWKAERAGAQDISQMTMSLATLFRIGLSRGQEIIAVKQEMEHVQSYLQIQKLRYGDKLNYTVDFEEDIMQLYTVKLILQPLVENAIYHGIKESENDGLISIAGRKKDGILELRVEDNGPGIPANRLEILNKDLQRGLCVSGDGYGIFNVNERIRLYFGTQYGLTLASKLGEGTVATITLPCITQSEVKDYVPFVDCGR